MTPDTILLILAQAATTTTNPCGPDEEAGAVCEGVYQVTGSEVAAEASDILLARPAKIAIILALALLISWLLRRAIKRFVRGLRTVTAEVTSQDRSSGSLLLTSAVASPRGAQRAETIGSLLSSAASAVIWVVALFMVFSELGMDVGPLIAGAGVVGVALGFGAQNLVRDFLSGVFMLIEDQYGVGDVIDAGPAVGIVEGVSLRTTRLRDLEGNVWHIPNGSIERVANMSQDWSRSLLDLEVGYGTDIAHAFSVIKRVADEMWRDPEWSSDITAEPEIWGVERFLADGMVIRLVVRTKPLSQWQVSRELRARLKRAFDAEGIEIPFPQRVVWQRQEPGGDAQPATPAGAGGSGPAGSGPALNDAAGDDAGPAAHPDEYKLTQRIQPELDLPDGGE